MGSPLMRGECLDGHSVDFDYLVGAGGKSGQGPRPNVFAVLALKTNSNFVGFSTGQIDRLLLSSGFDRRSFLPRSTPTLDSLPALENDG